jgi:hypothetical protein
MPHQPATDLGPPCPLPIRLLFPVGPVWNEHVPVDDFDRVDLPACFPPRYPAL